MHGSATTLCPAQCSYAALVTILDNSLINLLFRCVRVPYSSPETRSFPVQSLGIGNYRLRRLSESRLRKGCVCTGQPQKNESASRAGVLGRLRTLIQINRDGDAAVGFPN